MGAENYKYLITCRIEIIIFSDVKICDFETRKQNR